jgi:hypothetical protein
MISTAWIVVGGLERSLFSQDYDCASAWKNETRGDFAMGQV